MASYLSAPRIALAIERLSGSRAKAALFDFLIVKRTFAIKGSANIPITEKEQAFIKALDEFGACGEFKGQPVKTDAAYYLNPFATRQTGTQGYRTRKYRSNGTNSTIGGTHWRTVITLSTDDSIWRSRFSRRMDRTAGLGSEFHAPNAHLYPL